MPRTVVLACTCQEVPAGTLAGASTAKPSGAATVKDIMLSIIDPAADQVWNSVTTVQTAKGTEETVPKTAEDWLKVRHGAVTLSEAANLLKYQQAYQAAAQLIRVADTMFQTLLAATER